MKTYVDNFPPYSRNTSCDLRKQTNADRFRAMTDEELAMFFDLEAFLCPWCDVSCGGVEELPCRQCILKWLKQEVSDA